MQRYDGPLLDALRQKQRELGESDVAFARRLGLHRETWRLLRHGRLSVSLRALRGITAAFPELAMHAVDLTVSRNASKHAD